MFASFRDAPSWAQTRNPAPCTALDSGFVHSALLNERPGMTARDFVVIPEEPRACAASRRMEASTCGRPSRLAARGGEHLRMTAGRCEPVLVWPDLRYKSRA